MAPAKLRDLIRLIRSAKSSAEERAVVDKESAVIRQGFREENQEYRCRNVAKLLYIYMLGYPAHFGQLECLKLVASPRFSDKRIGYLGAMLLLDESKDVHLLVTNSLKNDLNHSNQYVAGLAACTLGSICSTAMARDLANEIEKLLKATNSYIRKKAVLCALRMIRKVPDLLDQFVPATRSLLGERNHGVLITGVTLITEMCRQAPESLAHFRRMTPTLVRLLKNLVMSGYSPEHDVNGSTDPFLQVALIRLLRLLGKGNAESSEAMNDILAQVATNTESSKNVGNSILYESVLCIMDIQAESGLRVLAINILGKFLLNNDRNIRYVALTTLLRTVQNTDAGDAVQRHRSTIIECLKETDITIRRRALTLAFALINSNNVRSLVKELLSFLEVADTEFKVYMTTEILLAADNYAPSRRWQVDTAIKVLEVAGAHIREDVIPTIIQLFAESPELHAYISQRLFKALSDNIIAQPLVQVGIWCLGEYGDLLTTRVNEEEVPAEINPSDVLDLMQTIMDSPLSTQVTREYTLTAIMKLSTRFDPSFLPRIKHMITALEKNVDVELQQRSAEYDAIFTNYNEMRPALLERMPVVASKTRAVASPAKAAQSAQVQAPTQEAPASTGDSLLDLLGDSTTSSAPVTSAPSGGGGDMLDLLGGLDMSGPSTSAAPPSSMGGGGLLDLMGDISSPSSQPSLGGADLMGSGLMGGISSAPVSQPSSSGMDGLLDLMGGGPSQPAASSGIPSVTAFEKDGLKITFDFAKDPGNPALLKIMMRARNSLAQPMNNFVFQAAVPKSFQLNLQAQSASAVLPHNSGEVSQQININNPQRQPLRMRLRITYMLNGQQIVQQGEVNNLPESTI